MDVLVEAFASRYGRHDVERYLVCHSNWCDSCS
jgi:hypothetical protein